MGRVAERFAALIDRVAQIPGGEQLADLRKGLAVQLGFDPFTRDGLLAAGLDPDRGAGMALLTNDARPQLELALPLTNPQVFLETAQRLLVERAGYSPLPPGAVKLFERKGMQVGLAVVRGYGVMARGPDAAKLVADVQARKPEQSLAKDEGLTAARRKLGTPDLLAYAPQGSEVPSRYSAPPLPGDVALAVTAAAQGLALRGLAQLPPASAARAQAALPGGGAWLTSLLPQDAPVRARLGVSPTQLLAILRSVPQVAPLLDRIDLLPLFATLQPGAAISLGVEKTANLAHLVDYGLDWRRETPFTTVQLVALAQVADEGRCMAALEALAKQLPSLGAQATRTQSEWSVTYAAGKGARFGLREIEGRKVVYVLGGAIDAAALKSRPPEKDPETAALAQDPGAALRADFGKLSDAVHALPESTYGNGPQSYVTRSLVSQIVEPLRVVRLNASALASQDSIDASVDLTLVAQ
jgi:hypothetical protein